MMSDNIPQLNELDVYPLYEDLFSDKAKKDMKRQCTSLLLQFNESTGVNIKPHDPYPDVDVGMLVFTKNQQIQDDPKMQFYRTLCKLGIGMETVRQIAPAKFFGVTIKSMKDIDKAAKIIAETVNNMAEADILKAHLTRLSAVQMHKAWNDMRPGRVAVYSIVHLFDRDFNSAYKAHDKYKIEFNEGGMPVNLEDIDAIRKK